MRADIFCSHFKKIICLSILKMKFIKEVYLKNTLRKTFYYNKDYGE